MYRSSGLKISSCGVNELISAHKHFLFSLIVI
jgi:hypothetical protein